MDNDATPPFEAVVRHGYVTVAGVEVFYREAGPPDAPVLLLPHGYPCSGYEFRGLMPALGDRWRTLAPDLPGCGHSATPDDFAYDFSGYAELLAGFCDELDVTRCVLWLHDFGSQIGLRTAIARPDLVGGLVIQNGDVYEDELGPGYDTLREYWDEPTPARRAALADAISLEGYREEFLNDLAEPQRSMVPPDLWVLHWALTDARRRQIHADVIAGLRENREWFPRYQSWLREHRPPTLIVWGPRDRYMPAGAARAYLRDLPDARLHLFDDGGHWLLETHLQQVVPLVREFLSDLGTVAWTPDAP